MAAFCAAFAPVQTLFVPADRGDGYTVVNQYKYVRVVVPAVGFACAGRATT